ncbi:FKBP-type peptidyl-prolyl cis-trans isomerase 2 [Lachnospiraceae bacterium XBB1006]|nr:FKBP-type peptidyl-prolyl cis-trans isomerase 2 [Lachnospiraceae bacterium XBB1006]
MRVVNDMEEQMNGGCGCGGGCGDGGSCCGDDSQGCGGCGGGCQPVMLEGKNAGKTCKVHYKGTFDNGEQFDSSYDRGEPLEFVCGVGMMIQGFDKAVVDMAVGEKKDIHLMPEEAYGLADPEAIVTFEQEDMPGSKDLEVGDFVYLLNTLGQQVPAKVVAKEGTRITFDANHEMAGKALNFSIELLEVQ